MNVRDGSRSRLIGPAVLLAFVAIGCGKAEPTAAPSEPRPAAAQVTVPAPETVVAELYEQQARDEGPFFQTKSRALVDKYFETTLADLIWKDSVTASGEVGALDFDPLYDAQDTDIKNFTIQPATAGGGRAQVVVTFENFDQKQKLTYSLVSAGDAWKIADIAFGEGRTLRGVYSADTTPSSVK